MAEPTQCSKLNLGFIDEESNRDANARMSFVRVFDESGISAVVGGNCRKHDFSKKNQGILKRLFVICYCHHLSRPESSLLLRSDVHDPGDVIFGEEVFSPIACDAL